MRLISNEGKQKRNRRGRQPQDKSRDNHKTIARQQQVHRKTLQSQGSRERIKAKPRQGKTVIGERERQIQRGRATERDKTERQDREIRQGDNTTQDSTLQYNTIPYHTNTIQNRKNRAIQI